MPAASVKCASAIVVDLAVDGDTTARAPNYGEGRLRRLDDTC